MASTQVIEILSSDDEVAPQTRAARRKRAGKQRAGPVLALDVIEIPDSDDERAVHPLKKARTRGANNEKNTAQDARATGSRAPSAPVAGPSGAQRGEEALPLFLPDPEEELLSGPAQNSVDSPVQDVFGPPALLQEADAAPLPEPSEGAGHNPQPALVALEPEPAPLVDPPTHATTDPLEAYTAQILDVLPDVLPAHARAMVEAHHAAHPENVVERVLHALFENLTYPRIEKGKRDEDEDVEPASTKAKVDSASSNEKVAARGARATGSRSSSAPVAGPSGAGRDDEAMPLFLPDPEYELLLSLPLNRADSPVRETAVPLRAADAAPDAPRREPSEGSGHNPQPPLPEAAAEPQPAPLDRPPTPEPRDPLEAYTAQVLGVLPDVLPTHARAMVEAHHAAHPENVVERVLHELFENPTYPRVEKGKKRKHEGDEDAERASTKAKIDYASRDRPRPAGQHYAALALDQLYADFPEIPVQHIRTAFDAWNHLYAPAHLFLLAESKSVSPPYKRKAASKRSKKGKDVAWADADVDAERAWLVAKLRDDGAAPAPAVAEQADDEEGVECGCCFTEHPFSTLIQCPEAHLFCGACVSAYAATTLASGDAALVCLSTCGCGAALPDAELRRALAPGLWALFERVRARREVEAAGLAGLEECPFCEYRVVIEDAGDRLFRCAREECGAVSCRECKKLDHLPKGCAEAAADEKLGAQHHVDEAMTRALMRNCPKCQKAFIKESGCNKMTCPSCRTLSCYICRQIISGYDHFNEQPGRGGASDPRKCKLWDAVEKRPTEEVAHAAQQALAEYKAAHPEFDEGDVKVDLLPAPAPAPPAAPARFGLTYADPPQVFAFGGAPLAGPAHAPYLPAAQPAWMPHAQPAMLAYPPVQPAMLPYPLAQPAMLAYPPVRPAAPAPPANIEDVLRQRMAERDAQHRADRARLQRRHERAAREQQRRVRTAQERVRATREQIRQLMGTGRAEADARAEPRVLVRAAAGTAVQVRVDVGPGSVPEVNAGQPARAQHTPGTLVDVVPGPYAPLDPPRARPRRSRVDLQAWMNEVAAAAFGELAGPARPVARPPARPASPRGLAQAAEAAGPARAAIRPQPRPYSPQRVSQVQPRAWAGEFANPTGAEAARPPARPASPRSLAQAQWRAWVNEVAAANEAEAAGPARAVPGAHAPQDAYPVNHAFAAAVAGPSTAAGMGR